MLFTILFGGSFFLVGASLLTVGLWMLYARACKLIRCVEETNGRAIDYILSKWKYASVHQGHVTQPYIPRWFPVYEYYAEGQRIVQKSRTCVLSQERPQEMMVRLRYDPKVPERYYVPGEFSLTGWVAVVLFLFNGIPFTVIGLVFLISNFAV